ncbi:hypothetical protein VTN96DRAFT_10460 [Rasamsonia emersonii]|uniref:CUE domain protein n=1 Tax=Rasamsonia emersonii (strain ATCC 16479 / CBS 393.64 / IMI 116815) TaxID=1408163 RepID=A0A0F4Z2W9_RASE3|nr:CUE domain protein [Rasamsonia emersonii CBS 393.64]KKA24218.1 CUE domain protein [Rasamsonia emersonii CBS 393.64]
MDESVVPRKRRRLFFESYSGPESTNVDGNTITCASMKEQQQQQQKLPQTSSTDENRSVVSCEEENGRPEENKFEEEEDDDTDVKLARLLSLFPDMNEADLLDVLVAYDGCVTAASAALEAASSPRKEKKPLAKTNSTAATPGIQTSLLSSFPMSSSKSITSAETSKSLTKKGKTLYLYAPEDIARHTPCTIIHNFLPPEEADALLVELLEESKTFQRPTFQLFENTVQSPHTASLYVSSTEDLVQQTSQYAYNGSYRKDVRQLTPRMRAVSEKVQRAVNEEIRKRIQTHYPGGKKLRYQSPKEWVPNAAFVNCYTGPSESVGYHSDQLTYLGPRAVIGSLSLGVAREFRVRRVVARDGDSDDNDADDDDDDDDDENDYDSNNDEKRADSHSTNPASSVKKKKRKPTTKTKDSIADAQGQISIHLPHNSLLVMHAEMQEEWKHSIPPVQTISPHPISGNRRINITYRWYRESLHPRYTPRCRCGMPTVLRCVQRKKETRGRYMWMCHAGYAPGKKGCSFFQWAEFDDDGEPIWNNKQKS